MAKRHSFRIPKKYFPGLVRVTDEKQGRVWHYRGKTFKTLRQVYEFDIERLVKKHNV